MTTVAVVRAELAEEFYFGDDAVLLAMDTAGMAVFLGALIQAEQQGSSRLDHGGAIHQFRIEPGASDIEFHGSAVVWRFDPAKAAEIAELLTHMIKRSGAGHQYVDISSPADTLVLSRDEYV
jgi:hypothetical protein